MNELAGHSQNWKFLLKSAAHGKLSHAYLFRGPEQVGKRTFGTRFLQWYFCKDRKGDVPCALCQECRAIEKGSHPHVSVLSPREGEIRIKDVLEACRELHFKSENGKAILIDDIHRANVVAQQALLKTLEDPPPQTLVIGVTSHPDDLLATLRSRFTHLRFSVLSEQEMRKLIPAGNSREELVRNAAGRPGMLLTMISHPQEEEWVRKRKEDLSRVLRQDPPARLGYARQIGEEERLEHILQIWLQYVRELMLRARSLPEMRSFASLARQLDSTYSLLSHTSVRKQTALETMLLDLPLIHSIK